MKIEQVWLGGKSSNTRQHWGEIYEGLGLKLQTNWIAPKNWRELEKIWLQQWMKLKECDMRTKQEKNLDGKKRKEMQWLQWTTRQALIEGDTLTHTHSLIHTHPNTYTRTYTRAYSSVLAHTQIERRPLNEAHKHYREEEIKKMHTHTHWRAEREIEREKEGKILMMKKVTSWNEIWQSSRGCWICFQDF